MELEELKLKWKVLSERLDREQVIRRQDMERMLRGRVGSYLHYVQLMLLLGVAVVPLCVAIGKFRGVSGIFIWWVVAGYLLCLLPSFFSLWLLLRVSRCDADIVECEHRMTRYAAFAGAYYIFQYVVVILFVAGMLLYAAGYYTAHGMWWTVAALLSLTAVACIVITHHEWGRIRDLQRRIRELQVYFYGDYTGNESDPGFRYLVHMPNGGSLEDNRVLCYPRGETYAALQTATRSGMYFAGWYTAASGGAHITNSTPAAENLIVYAHWSSTPVENPNEDNGGSGEDPVTLKTSEACIQFIKDHEGFSKFAYWDYGQWTIGYGTRCEENEFPDGITEEEADQRLRLMLVDFEKMVDDVLDASPLVHTQSQYDAMISFTFNLGPQWINPKYNIYQYFVYGGYTEMEFVNTMGRWLSSSSEVVDGLAKRRIDEADMYLNGVYRLGSTAYVRVVFNAMGGEAEEDYVYYKTGRSLGMLPNAYRSGHYFVGWYDRALSGGTCYTPETTAPARGNITLYARWEATGLPYQDISRDAWYFEAVSEATDRGLFQGTSETTFEPESTMNRAMLATVIYRMAGSPAGAAKAPFTDVAAADWFADAVAWAYENGVVKGMSATSFAPLQEITREQLAVMLLRYADLCGYDTSARTSLKDFADAAKVSDYAADAMQWAVANGVINGTSATTLEPAGTATRAQAATVLVRFQNSMKS